MNVLYAQGWLGWTSFAPAFTQGGHPLVPVFLARAVEFDPARALRQHNFALACGDTGQS